ncbi:glycerate kinase [Arthrobacter crystallopoietes]|uniref:glycerate kinase n=1 Tax=Crystallibacter crystallopoietes TaxID=37928 RepID=UPI001ABDC095|nr:glycerate kinase [Arthrobacter crystallopoietes]QTG81859.1 glycerate kinase [Arthrobacter crystallopoietes]
MKVLVAPDKFKGTLSAAEAAQAMAEGVLRVYPDAEVRTLPVADGGEGTLEAALAAGAQEHTSRVRGPLDREVTASWAMLDRGGIKTAVIETARASGLLLTEPSVQTALAAHSYGSGQLIAAALDAGAEEVVLGIGGSAMTDGGSGALCALGLKIYDGGAQVPLGGAGLATAHRIDASGLDARLGSVTVRIAADVDNPLHGPEGAAHVFGQQKGADATGRQLLDEGLQRWAELLRQETGAEVNVPGAGAAGGFPAGFLGLTKARLERGFDLVAELTGLDAALDGTDLVITGEGSMDAQSEYGKAPMGIADRAHERGIPAVVVAGKITLTAEQLAAHGVEAAVSLLDLARTPEEAFAQAAKYVTWGTQQALEGA